MRRVKTKEVDPAPLMLRGSTEFEEKRILCDFELVFKQVAELGLTSFKDTYEFVYRKAFVAGQAAEQRKSGHSSLEASVRETAGAMKETTDGIITSD